jgi:hypothetical protein
MLVRVATNDVESAKLLVVDLVGRFGAEHVSPRPTARFTYRSVAR